MILTSIDVAILYQIITSAEQSPDIESLPFRAIFAAYDNILAQNGLDPDYDQVYLRFLFRLGDRKLPNRSLYESFESLLEEFGIQIEINPGDDGGHEITRDLSADNGTEYETYTQPNMGERSRKTIRRASFQSLYDIENESTRASRTRPQSRATSSNFPPGQRAFSRERPSTRASTRPTERTPQRPSRSQTFTGLPERSRLTAQKFVSNLENTGGTGRTNNSFLRNTALGTLARQPSAADLMGRSTSPITEITNSEEQAFIIPNGIQPTYTVSQQELLYRPSATQQMRDVETFEYYRIKAVARNIFRKWHLAALQAKQSRKKMEIVAINHDIGILVRQGFEHWQMRFRTKRQAVETDRFFYRLEQRAAKARDLFLLTKAFTHWAECAYEQVLHTSMVRRHLLSLKYFNAWREITAVNELKVRRQRLRKFFGLWKQKCVHYLTDEATAVTLYHGSLRKTMYWRWFWKFCEKSAPEWKNTRLRMKCFSTWVLRFREISQTERLVSSRRCDEMKRMIYTQWLAKTRLEISSSQQAAAFSRQNLTARWLQAWKLGLRLKPLAQQISNTVDWRIAGTTFDTFVYRFRIERYAAEVNRRRIMRSAWTQWNDRLRCKTLSQQIDDRFLLEALYKWVIAERSILLQRLNALRLKRRLFSRIAHRFQIIQGQRSRSCQIIEHNRNRKTLRSAFEYWKQRQESSRQDEQTALIFYNPRIAQEALQVWSSKYTHTQFLERRAMHARFYLLVSDSLKRWRAAVAESKRAKRRDAYAQVRRKLKMALARNAIRLWGDLTNQLAGMNNQAQDFNQNRLLRVGTTLFDKWKARCDFIIDHEYQIDDFYRRKVVNRQFQTWLERLRTQQEHEVRAQRFLDLQVGRLAFEGLHKLRLQMIELQGSARKAESLRILHERRHHHNFLRIWYAKAASRRGLPPRDTTFSSRPKRFGVRHEAAEDATSRAEEWTAFEDGFDLGDWIPALEAQASATPLPSHLSTPSKRTARARRALTTSHTTTPAGTPFRPIPAPRDPDLPPPEKSPQQPQQSFRTPGSQPRRRAAFASGLGMSRFGRTGAGLRGSMFGAIIEDEPRTPGA